MKTVHSQLTILALLIFFHALATNGQEGEQLFNVRCSSCHQLDKNMIGPKLQGVQEKWNQAGEGALLYQWVKNSKGLILSGESSLAAQIKSFNIMEMPAQDVTNEEIDQIFTYVASVTNVERDSLHNGKIENGFDDTALAGYSTRLTYWYLLMGTGFFSLIVIISISKSIQTLLRSKVEFENPKGRSSRKAGLATLGCLLLIGISQATCAMSIAPESISETEAPWIMIEWWEISLLLGLNFILVLIILYLRSIFNTVFKSVNKSFKSSGNVN
ncbi:MAG: mono/diheme cytochrome c family protein [Flavobacteriaceae bacterium]|jgi:mono/diheme cytochrome c family protein